MIDILECKSYTHIHKRRTVCRQNELFYIYNSLAMLNSDVNCSTCKQKHHAFDDTYKCMYGKYKKTPLEIIKPYLIDYKVY